MAEGTNGQWLLRARPDGMVRESDFEYVETPIPEPGDGEILVRNLWFGFDPAMRGWIEDVKSYIPPVQLGEVMRASTVGQVVKSKSPHFREGQLATGLLGWQEYAVASGDPRPMVGVTPVPSNVPPTAMLGVLGGTGMTAYWGMMDVGQVKAGDVVVVSGAAGATGSVAGQIAKIQGARKVIGIAGGARKCGWLREIGFDAAIDYKGESVPARLREECHDAIDLYFDNVGGEILDAVLLEMAQNGRIALCGAISGYNEKEPPPGPRNLMQIVIRRLTVRGFIVIDYLPRAAQAVGDLATWLAEGRLKHAEDVQEGIENTPKTFLRLFEGRNLGKQILKIAEPPLPIPAS